MEVLVGLKDAELLALMHEGAFNEIYSRYWKPFYQSAYSLLGDADGAHDVVQEIFVWLWPK